MTGVGARVRNVVLDLDGTLVDSFPGIRWSVERALADTGLRGTKDDLRSSIGPSLATLLRAAAPESTDADLCRLHAAFRARYDAEGWRKTACFAGAERFLEKVGASGRRAFLVTNKPRLSAGRILDALDLRRYFTETLSPDSPELAPRSKAEMIEYLLLRHGLGAADSVLVGDSVEDCAAGAATQLEVLIMRHGYGAEDVARSWPECRIVAGFSELEAAIF